VEEDASVKLETISTNCRRKYATVAAKYQPNMVGRSRPSHPSSTTSVQEHLLAGPSELAWLAGFATGFVLEAGQRRSIQ
jgi:hypothetical protein